MSRHYKKIKSIFLYKKELKKIIKEIRGISDREYITIYNNETIGVMNSTIFMFKNCIAIPELLNINMIDIIAKEIAALNFKQVIFSSITYGKNELIQKIKYYNEKIVIKIFWHGSHAMLVERDEEYFLNNILQLHNKNKIDAIAFAKESMANFYKHKGYNSFFLPNVVNINKDEYINKEKSCNITDKNDKVKIGLYSAGNRWEKNTFNQLSAASMINNHVVDIFPKTELVEEFINLTNINVTDFNSNNLKRSELLKRMALNDVNLYVTFTECSPLIPLESLELGVPCITGNNHHYFLNSKLSEFLIVKSEDDIDEIYDKIITAIKYKDEINILYKDWKAEYKVTVEKLLTEFLEYKL